MNRHTFHCLPLRSALHSAECGMRSMNLFFCEQIPIDRYVRYEQSRCTPCRSASILGIWAWDTLCSISSVVNERNEKRNENRTHWLKVNAILDALIEWRIRAKGAGRQRSYGCACARECAITLRSMDPVRLRWNGKLELFGLSMGLRLFPRMKEQHV